MKWRQVDEHYAVSDCGFYTVTKLAGVEGAPVYLAWYRFGARPSSATGKASLCLARCADSKAADRACRNHQRSVDSTTAPPPAAEEFA